MFCEIYLQSAAHITTIHDSFIGEGKKPNEFAEWHVAWLAK